MIDEQIAIILKELRMTCRKNSRLWSNLNVYSQGIVVLLFPLLPIFMLVLLNLPEYPFAKLINLFFFLFCLSFNVP